MYPKLVALDTDWTIFWGWLKSSEWGKGKNAYSPVEDNIKKTNDWEIHDHSNRKIKCGMYEDIPRIIHDILKNGAKLAIVSRNTSKAMCDRALWYFKVQDAHGNEKSLIDLVEFDEVYDSDKVVHFRKIKGWTGFNYSDMILYDDAAINNDVEMMLGVTFQVSRNKKGLTWTNYQHGLDIWRRTKAIHSPWHGLQLDRYPKKKLLGYSGMDLETIKLLEQGSRRHDRKEAARWGFAMYVADNPAVAKYFREWIKKTTFGDKSKTIVCAIYARDGEIFDRMNKIWVPDKRELKTSVKDKEPKLAWSQEDRDRQIEKWGVKKPYILFSRHPNMKNGWGMSFPVPHTQRWNEMVVYGQTQENLILTVRMTESELNQAINSGKHLHYEKKFSAWNIEAPHETKQDFTAHGEHITTKS